MLRWLKLALNRKKTDAQLNAELTHHLQERICERIAAGDSPEESYRKACLEFGGLDQIKEQCRDMLPARWLDDLVRDAGYGIRTLARSRGFSLAAILSLALGVGVMTSLYGIVDGLFLNPLPVHEPDRLMSLQSLTRSGRFEDSLAFPEYLHYRDYNNAFSGLAAHEQVKAFFGDGDEGVAMVGELVSSNYFDVLRIRPALGRWFAPEEDQTQGGNPVVVLGYGLWRRAFAADPAALGREIRINRSVFRIIGVAPAGFMGLQGSMGSPRSEFWAPVSMFPQLVPGGMSGMDLLHMWGNQWIHATGRLRPGLSHPAAETSVRGTRLQLQDRLSETWGAMSRSWVDNPSVWTAALIPAPKARIPAAQRTWLQKGVWLLGGTAMIVLLVACINLSGLMLQRSLSRGREFSLRFSLGATRARVFRQLLVEAVLLSGFGAVGGLAVASGAAAFLESFGVQLDLARALETARRVQLASFAVAVSVMCVLISSWPPIRHALDAPASAMKGDGDRLRRIGRLHLRDLLMGCQVAFALVLLTGAGLFVRTLVNMRSADITVDPGNVLLTHLRLPPREQPRGFYESLLSRLRAFPGVKSAALVIVPPLGGDRGGTNISTPEGKVQVDFNVISPEYFTTVGMPVIRGRAFTERDRADLPPVALVNEPFARRFFSGKNPIGNTIRVTFRGAPPNREIIGIVRDGPFRSVRDPVKPCFYVPLAQFYPVASASGMAVNMWLEVRTVGDPSGFIPALRRELRSLDRDFPIGEIVTLRSHREAGFARERMMMQLLVGFALLALLLSAVGVYGTVSFTATQRTREIGVRIALGAKTDHVARLVLGRAFVVISAAIACGAAIAVALAHLAAGLLFGVGAADPFVFGIASGLLLLTALAAVCNPVRHALRIPPMEALHCE